MKPILAACALLFAALPAVGQESPAADSGRVYEPAELTAMPRVANAEALRAALRAGYPPELAAAGVEGTVSVSLVVNQAGEAEEIAVVESTNPAFDSVTVATVAGLRFRPAMVGGRPVRTRVRVPIRWQLPEAPVAAANPPADFTGVGVGLRRAPRPDSSRTYKPRQVEVPPQPINMISVRAELVQRYPASLRGSGRRGTVHVRFRVNADGRPEHFEITRSSDARFNAPTLEAVRVLRFTPARVNGRAVAAWVELPIEWESI